MPHWLSSATVGHERITGSTCSAAADDSQNQRGAAGRAPPEVAVRAPCTPRSPSRRPGPAGGTTTGVAQEKRRLGSRRRNEDWGRAGGTTSGACRTRWTPSVAPREVPHEDRLAAPSRPFLGRGRNLGPVDQVVGRLASPVVPADPSAGREPAMETSVRCLLEAASCPAGSAPRWPAANPGAHKGGVPDLVTNCVPPTSGSRVLHGERLASAPPARSAS
jgi:hypothetical protein